MKLAILWCDSYTVILLYFSPILSSNFITDKRQHLGSFPRCVVPHFVCLHFLIGSGKSNFQNSTSKRRQLLFEGNVLLCMSGYLHRSRTCSVFRDSHLHLLAPTHHKHQRSALGTACFFLRHVISAFLCCHMFYSVSCGRGCTL